MKHANIFLIGFMGSGKSYWGEIWAAKHNLAFVDLDQEIEKESGMSIGDIFEKRGEEAFRELEKSRLHKIKKNRRLLIACGGGTPCFSDNMEWMLANGIVVYLKAPEKYILQRVMDETGKRPLLKKVNESELLFFIEKTLKTREPVYKQARITLNAELLTETSLANVLEEVRAGNRPKGAGENSDKTVIKH